MNFTVERCYCHGPLSAGDERFLMAETFDFVSQHNKLFLSRPDWMASATCFSAYGLACGYLVILYTTITNSWKKMAVPILLMLGAKIYALLFYHYMEFTHTLAPAGSSLPLLERRGAILFRYSSHSFQNHCRHKHTQWTKIQGDVSMKSFR